MIKADNNKTGSRYLRVVLLSFTLVLSGCASTNGPPDEGDPFESYNRAMYKFNDALDKAVLTPAAQAYKDNIPHPVQSGVSNFFSNLDDAWVFVNDLFQFKFKQAASDLSRFVWNSTVGLFGFIDVATSLDLPKHDEDFGQTLGSWGVGEGPYLVLPILGPSNIRDAGGLVADYGFDPLVNIKDNNTYWGLWILRGIDWRASLLGASKVVEQAALDPYVFVRDAYLQRRRSLVYDGNPPQEKPPLPKPSDEDLELELELEKMDQKP